MATSVHTHRRELRTLCAASPSVRKAILESADLGLTHCLCECALNVLKGNVELHPIQKRKLSRHKKTLRGLIKPGISWKRRRNKLIQGGGAFIPLLLGPILASLVTSLVR